MQFVMTATLSTLVFLFGIRVLARTRYPKERKNFSPFVGVSNHSSSLDGAAEGFIGGISKWTVIVKGWVMKVPPFSYFLDKGRGIPLETKNDIPLIKAIQKAMEKADEFLKAGYNVMLFPEGTRLADPTKVIGTFRDGAVKLAFDNNAPVISFLMVWPILFMPVHFKGWLNTGTIDILENHTFFPKDYANRREMNKDIHDAMERDLLAWLRLKRFNYKLKSPDTV